VGVAGRKYRTPKKVLEILYLEQLTALNNTAHTATTTQEHHIVIQQMKIDQTALKSENTEIKTTLPDLSKVA